MIFRWCAFFLFFRNLSTHKNANSKLKVSLIFSHISHLFLKSWFNFENNDIFSIKEPELLNLDGIVYSIGGTSDTNMSSTVLKYDAVRDFLFRKIFWLFLIVIINYYFVLKI